jgi:hypothetical protein
MIWYIQIKVYEAFDSDGDSLWLPWEDTYTGLDPDNPDSDGDGTHDCNEDLDSDGLLNNQECRLGTNPIQERFAIVIWAFPHTGNTNQSPDVDWEHVISTFETIGFSIYYAGYDTHDPDYSTELESKATVHNKISEVATQSDENDLVFFFYHGHGTSDSVETGEDNMLAHELDAWLDTVTCSRMIVAIASCRSGSFIGKTTGDDDLTGEGETNRIVFTSVASYEEMWAGDLDPTSATDPSDPNQQTDLGVEFISGFYGAFTDHDDATSDEYYGADDNCLTCQGTEAHYEFGSTDKKISSLELWKYLDFMYYPGDYETQHPQYSDPGNAMGSTTLYVYL